MFSSQMLLKTVAWQPTCAVIAMMVESKFKGTRSMLNKAKVTKARLASRMLSGEDSTNTANVAMVTCHTQQHQMH
jgi:hypothetical protein